MKTPEQILLEHSPNPMGGYQSSWVIDAMKEYAKQWVVEASLRLNTSPRWDAEVVSMIDKINEQ